MTRPVCILVAAMGGEGGGVLADWLVDAASRMDFPVQSTSVPGVAQRTGATTYYIEIFPQARQALGGREPVLSLTPTPGHVDLVAATELVEAGRAIQNGWVDPGRTVLVTSSHREYAVSEKSDMADGRFDDERIVQAAAFRSRALTLLDLRALSRQQGTVINTVLFGVMAATPGFPLSRHACEEAIRASGKAVQASLRGFAAGYTAREVASDAPPAPTTSPAVVPPGAEPGLEGLPPALREVVRHGMRLAADFQDRRYADLYLARVLAIASQEQAQEGCDWRVSVEVARHLALWMAFEDVIRVADLKTRRERLDQIRREVAAGTREPVRVTEFLKPGLDELLSLLPTGAARALARAWGGRLRTPGKGLHLRSDTLRGFLMLVALRSLRPLRRHMSRFAQEDAAIREWLQMISGSLKHSPEVAREVALCASLVKGYGQTHERGRRNLSAILSDLQRQLPSGGTEATLAQWTRDARLAALTDPQGRRLAQFLGLPVPELVAQPIRFFPGRRATEGVK